MIMRGNRNATRTFHPHPKLRLNLRRKDLRDRGTKQTSYWINLRELTCSKFVLFRHITHSHSLCRHSPSPEAENGTYNPPFEYKLRDTGSESPPSLDDAILAPSTSQGRKTSLSDISPIQNKKENTRDMNNRLNSTNKQVSKRKENSDKIALDTKEVSPKKKIEEKQSRKEKETENAKKADSYSTKIKVSRSANFEDDEDKPKAKKKRSNIHESDRTDEDDIEVSNPLASKSKTKKHQLVDIANSRKPSAKLGDKKKENGLFENYDVINSYIMSRSQEEKQNSPQSLGGRKRATAKPGRLPESKRDGGAQDEEVARSIRSQLSLVTKSTNKIDNEKPKPKPKARAASHQKQPQISTYFKPSVKPSDIRLCPVCDKELPRFRTQHLKTVLKEFLNIAKTSPRSSNPYGMKAHVVAESELCTAHELDTKVIPEGRKKGYPIAHDWNRLSDRIMKLCKRIKGVIKSKESSRFWIKAREDYAKVGSRKANGLDVQFENFEDEQPG